MAAANPFYIPVDRLPEACRPNGLDRASKVAPLTDDDAAAELAEKIISHHEDQLLQAAVPIEDLSDVSSDKKERQVFSITKLPAPRSRKPNGRWKRSVETSKDAGALAAFYEGKRWPPRALIALAHALGVWSHVERFLEADRTAQRSGSLEARDHAGEARHVNNAWLAQRAGLEKRSLQQQRNDYADKDHGLEARIQRVKAFYLGEPPSDPRELARAFREAVPLPDLPPDAAGRVIATFDPDSPDRLPYEARLVAWHLVRVGGAEALGAPKALDYALGLVTRTRTKGNW